MLTKSHISVAQNASGRSLNVPIYRISQNRPGPKVYIQSSIHGAEVQGNVVIYHLIQKLSQQEIFGEIWLVPNCNPVGTNIKAGEYTLGRFDPVNGTNWNRGYFYDEQAVIEFAESVAPAEHEELVVKKFDTFWEQKINDKLKQPWGLGLAQRLNLTLQLLAHNADIVMDLHNGPVSSRHIYIPEYASQDMFLFNVPHNIIIPNKFAGALDEACFCPWWTLQDILSARYHRQYDFKKRAFTIEMGSQEVINFEEGIKDADSILAYLSAKNVIDSSAELLCDMPRYKVNLSDYKTMFTEFGGMVEYVAKPGQHMKQGELMARVLNIDELDNQNAVHEVRAPADLIPILHFPSASILSGTQLYKCFLNYKRIT